MGCHSMGSQVLTATRHNWMHPAVTPARGWYLIYLPQGNGRLSWPRWLITYWDGSPIHRRSPIQVITWHHTAECWTCDLLITSPMPYPLHHQSTQKRCQNYNLFLMWVLVFLFTATFVIIIIIAYHIELKPAEAINLQFTCYIYVP